MQAIQVRRFGGPEVLEVVALERPTPQVDQVLVEVEFSGVTFIETQLRSGHPPRAAMVPELPMVPGNGVGGTICALGPGTEPGWLGRRVVSSLRGRGGYAQYAVADAASVVAVPDGLAVDQATALLADGRTAHAMLDATRTALGARAAAPPARGPLSGARVLVAPAGGGVGTLLVSLLARDHAHVLAAAGRGDKLDLARARGAELAVNYRDPEWVDAARAEVGEVDVLLDGVGGAVGDAALSLLAAGGVVCRFGAASGTVGSDPAQSSRPDAHAITLGPISPARQHQLVSDALADADAGGIGPVIGQRFALTDAAGAHRAVEGRATLGKTLLEGWPRSSAPTR